MAFDKIPKIDFQPLQQTSISYPEAPVTSGISVEPDETPLSVQVVNNFNNTIRLFDWLIGQFDTKIKDVVVHIDPEQDPEVWMAMKRIFKDTANQNLSGQSYLTVIDALEEISNIEYQEATNEVLAPELDFINSISDTGETQSNPIPSSGTAEDLAALADATQSVTRMFAKDPPVLDVKSIPRFNTMQRENISTSELYEKAIARLKYENGKNSHVEYIGGVKYLVWEI